MKLSITKINKAQKELDDAFSTLIRASANWICAVCGTSEYLHTHHIIPRENRPYRYSEDNGICLCAKHHKFSRVISAHNNPLSFYIWLEKFKPNLYKIAVERTKLLLKNDGIEL